MRNTNTGTFEIYDITNNGITSAAPMGQVGLKCLVTRLAADLSTGAPNSQLVQAMASSLILQAARLIHDRSACACAVG